MKSNVPFRRFWAYLIDFLVITIISSALTYISFINPRYEEYREVSDKYSELLTSYYEGDVDREELVKQTREMSYEMNNTGFTFIIGDIVVTILYFAGFAFVTKGQTLGKKLMGIKIVSAKDKELNFFNYFIRAFILNGIIINIITLIAVGFSKSTYYKIYDVGSNLDTILMIVISLMILFNKEERGLHDVIAGTKVIDVKREVVEETEIIKKEKREDDKNE